MADSHEGKGFNQVEGIVLDAPAAQGNGSDALGITMQAQPVITAPPDYFGDLVKLIASRLGVPALDPGDPGKGILLGAADGSRYSAKAIVNAICNKLDEAHTHYE